MAILTQIFAAKWEGEHHPQYFELLDKFIFHMMEIVDDVFRMAEVFRSPESVPPTELGNQLHHFFLHALPHLVSAGQLYDFVPEIFPEQRGVHMLPDEAPDDESPQ